MNKIKNWTFNKDYRFWLLFFVINMSGNLCFGYFFPDRITIICLALLVSFYLYKNKDIYVTHLLFTLCFFAIFALQAFYLSDYSLQSSLHFLLKIYTGFGVALIVGDKFIGYYKNIMIFFCLVSLFCFSLNCMKIVIPYINVSSSNIDGGQIIRVSSFVYTQLYNVEHGFGLTLRNCGPFWEPGAFQGFVNLALLLEMYNLRIKGVLISKTAIIYIVTIFTTVSTGGYVTMFAIVGFLIIQSKKMSLSTKVIFFIIVLSFFAYLFVSLDFLGEKISNDANRSGGRLNLDFSNLDVIRILFGSGLDPKSFLNSSLVAVGSLIMLINYTGILGGIIFYAFLYRDITTESFVFILIVSMILINEPFLTAGPFWWCLPELVKYVNRNYRVKSINDILNYE